MKTIATTLLLVALTLAACAPAAQKPSEAQLLAVLNEALRIEASFARQATPDGTVVPPSILSLEQQSPGAANWVVTFGGAWLDPVGRSPEPGILYHNLEVVVNADTGQVDSYAADK